MDAQDGYRPLAGDDDARESDDLKLKLLGYKQQLGRDVS
jgi:hypothetical protein